MKIFREFSLFRDRDRRDGAILRRVDGGGDQFSGEFAGLGHGQRALHGEHLRADTGTLGAADAQVRVNECFHKTYLQTSVCR